MEQGAGSGQANCKQIALFEKQPGLHVSMSKAGMTPDLLLLVLAHVTVRHVTVRRFGHPYSLHKQDPTAFTMIYLRDEVAFILGFYGLLRRSEIIALKVSDINIVEASGVGAYIIRIRKSKTDQAGRGEEVIMAGVSRHGVKVGDRIKKWVNKRRLSSVANGESPLLPAWKYAGRQLSEEHLKDGQALAGRLKIYLNALKIKYSLPLDIQYYAIYSLKRGGVIAAWEAGVPRDLLKIHGRWRSEAIEAYLQAPISLRLKVTGG